MIQYRCQVNATAPDGWRLCPAPTMSLAAAYVARRWAEPELAQGPVRCRVWVVVPDIRSYENGSPIVVHAFDCVVG